MKRLLMILICLVLACGCAAGEDAVSSATLKIDKLPEAEAEANGILVVYFSPDDTTKAAAYAIAAELKADLFEIAAEEPYTADDLNYYDSKSRSMTEMKDSQIRPPVAALPEDLSRYDTIWLGYPIWGGQAPKIMYTFLESVDLSGKTIVPFCTSNSSGIGSSAVNLQKAAGESVKWEEGGRIKKGSNAEDITRWVRETCTAEASD